MKNLTIKDKWDIIFERIIKAQPEWRDLCFYHLIGVLLDEKKKDLRVHVIFVAFTTTGKSEGIALVQSVLKKLGYKVKKPVEVTDRHLVGSKKETPGKEDEVDYGWLYDVQSLGFSEAEMFFEPRKHNENIQLIIREAMDRLREISKGVGGVSIEYKTNTSFIMTAFPKQDVLRGLMDTGIFQRAFFLYKEAPALDEHREIRNHLIDSYFSQEENPYFKESKEMQSFLEDLKSVKVFYDQSKGKISEDEELEAYVKSKFNALEGSFETMQIKNILKLVLEAMIRRGITSISKIATINAILNKRTVVTKEDVDVAFDLFAQCVASVRLAAYNLDSEYLMKVALKIIMKGKQVNATELFKMLKNATNFGNNKIWSFIKKAKAKKWLVHDGPQLKLGHTLL